MSFLSVTKVEFTKLLRKRISLLLLLFFMPAVLFGIGMLLGLSFFVSDGGGGGVDAVEKSLSGIGFAVTIMEQSKYIISLVIIILAAFTLSGELENGQIKSEIIRICSRSKIVVAKYVALSIDIGCNSFVFDLVIAYLCNVCQQNRICEWIIVRWTGTGTDWIHCIYYIGYSN